MVVVGKSQKKSRYKDSDYQQKYRDNPKNKKIALDYQDDYRADHAHKLAAKNYQKDYNAKPRVIKKRKQYRAKIAMKRKLAASTRKSNKK